MPGRRAPLHDRFLIADGRVWLSGNSLNAIGTRASLLIELPNPEEVLNHLAPIIERTELFSTWLSQRRARTGPGRERSAQIRQWAKQRGYKVNERGRIPANIVAEYEAAH